MKALLVNIALLAGSVVLTLVALEFFTLFVEVTDNIDYEHLPAVGLRLVPGQTGVYLRAGIDGGEPIKARFHVNNAGFNQPRDYQQAKPAGRFRIAVVGDSFVEALQVDFEDTFFYRLERELRAAGLEAEVYTFGISGNGTSQAYHMIDEVALRYSPSLVIYLFIPNDLEDSSPYRGGPTWSQQYDLSPEGELVALPFPRYRLSAVNALLKRSRLMRFILYQHHLLAKLRTQRAARRQSAAEGAAASGRAGAQLAEERAWTIVERLLQKVDRRLAAAGVPWLLVWQGDAEPGFHAEKRERLAALAERRGLWYFDPSGDFEASQAHRRQSFRIHGDGHWNRHGHRVVGGALAREMLAALEDPSGVFDLDELGRASLGAE